MKPKTYLCRSHCATKHVLANSVLREVTPKGELLPALCHASATLTLDHSQNAEKVYVCVSKTCFHTKARA